MQGEKVFFREKTTNLEDLNHTAKLLLPIIQSVPFFKHDLFLYIFFKILMIFTVQY